MSFSALQRPDSPTNQPSYVTSTYGTWVLRGSVSETIMDLANRCHAMGVKIELLRVESTEYLTAMSAFSAARHTFNDACEAAGVTVTRIQSSTVWLRPNS